MMCLLLLSNITNDPSYDPFPSVSTAVDPKPKTVAVLIPTLLLSAKDTIKYIGLLLLLLAKQLNLNLLLMPQRLTYNNAAAFGVLRSKIDPTRNFIIFQLLVNPSF
jgi:hypothetical protein